MRLAKSLPHSTGASACSLRCSTSVGTPQVREFTNSRLLGQLGTAPQLATFWYFCCESNFHRDNSGRQVNVQLPLSVLTSASITAQCETVIPLNSVADFQQS